MPRDLFSEKMVFLLLLLPVVAFGQTQTAGGEECAICTVGCAPYSAIPYPSWSQVAYEMAEECALIIHVGDTQAGSAACNMSSMMEPLGRLNDTGTPTLYTVGDNEINDCHRAYSSGTPADYYVAEEARQAFVDVWFQDLTTDLTGTLAVETQSADCPFNVYVERCGAAVVTVEIPGSQWYLADETALRPLQNDIDPIADRIHMYNRAKDCTLAWLDDKLAVANATGLRAVLVNYHASFWLNADSFGSELTTSNFGGDYWNMSTLGHLPYQPISDKFFELADTYPHIAIYTVHADWHYYRVMSPLKQRNLVDVMTDGSAEALTTYLKFTIDDSQFFDPVQVKKQHVERAAPWR